VHAHGASHAHAHRAAILGMRHRGIETMSPATLNADVGAAMDVSSPSQMESVVVWLAPNITPSDARLRFGVGTLPPSGTWRQDAASSAVGELKRRPVVERRHSADSGA
jgi:hypothetical protein